MTSCRWLSQMPVGGDNLFGLQQYDGQTSFFDPQNPILSQVQC